MDHSLFIDESDDDVISSIILKKLEDYSKLSLSILSSKKMTPTRSQSINLVLNGGIYTQEITEFFGDDFEASGELLTHLIFENLEADPLAEAVIITTNYSQNEDRLRDVCRDFYKRTKKAGTLDEYISNILKRIYIVPCLSLNDLYNILNTVFQNKYKEDSTYQLRIVTIHIFSSLFYESDPVAIKNHSRSISFILRNLSIKMNCAVFVANFQTQLSTSNDSAVDPYLETDNAAFSKLSEVWHSIINTRIHIQSSSVGNLLMIKAKVVKGKMSGYPEATISIINSFSPLN